MCDAETTGMRPSSEGRISEARQRYRDAIASANEAARQLDAAGREDRLAGLVVACDIGVSAAFMFSVSDRDYDRAAEVVRDAVHRALAEATDPDLDPDEARSRARRAETRIILMRSYDS